MDKEKFVKALCLSLVNERPEVVMNLLKKAGIECNQDTPIMDVIHSLRNIER